MSDVSDKKSWRRKRSIYKVHYCLPVPRESEMTRPLLPGEVWEYGRQVAGHMAMDDRRYLGLLQCSNGTILKPIIKPEQQREVDFYERISETTEDRLQELRKLTPKYLGCRMFTYNGFEQRYIVLEDLAHRMIEPCIMDIKIGRITWDHLATEEKILREQSKYPCRQEFGFCIPGYQVYELPSGRLHKSRKEDGKKMRGKMVVDALHHWAAGSTRREARPCRRVALGVASALWAVAAWAGRGERARGCAGGGVTLRGSSLLLAYDAAAVRDCCRHEQPLRSARCRSTLPGPALACCADGEGPGGAKPSPSPPRASSPWSEALDRLGRVHSFECDYSAKLAEARVAYRAALDRLSSDAPGPVPTVKVIDFAHARFEDAAEDLNFREGVESLLKVFEGVLVDANEW